MRKFASFVMCPLGIACLVGFFLLPGGWGVGFLVLGLFILSIADAILQSRC